ncbi:hypothetical protein [Streptomyces sp. NPDC048419]|uniref:hypothetical protein n=1 Tax=Streptomyces sp. NPDC048419 TaxID=3365547 RepID=UPI003713D89C
MRNTGRQVKTKCAAQKDVATAILESTIAQVDAVTEAGGGPDTIGSRLHRPAEAYVLVVRGKSE